ncbi:tyrosine-type recombinase/integrase [Campylobacter fetus]|uniref:tyrosine-type recombinase/integrase n=1 Tax=Campylobacter fetus TaxID=196 RepID=UPI000FCB9198|nr:site-specific integrase [Campylobacter fetus]RUT51014.1 hypothetical protein BWK67_00380 [Campylobacter fetus]RUT51742.1 hypothetical protein BWK51_00380 [Campylobacter fetus]
MINDIDILTSTKTKIYITPNLYLRNGKRKRSWYKVYNKKETLIGYYPEISLNEALEKSTLNIKNKKLKDVFTQFFKYKQAELSKNTINKYLLRFNLIPKYSSILDMDIRDITKSDIIQLYKNINKFESVRKTHTILKQTFEYAIIHDYIDINILQNIPINMLVKKPLTKHYRYTTDTQQIKNIIIIINSLPLKLRVAFILLIYTNLRVGTLVQLKVSHIDFKHKLLKVPADIMKMNIEHTLPLNTKTLTLLKTYIQTKDISNYLFPSEYSREYLNPEVFRLILRKKNISKSTTSVHGFRAMFSTICNDNELDSLGIEWILAHYQASTVARAYNHSQGLSRKEKVLNFWWNYLEEIEPFNLNI